MFEKLRVTEENKMILENLSGPVIGAVIGYFTNYIAVKMLFYPRKEIRVMGHKLPFTPGAIPKGKPRLAKAMGEIVSNTLLTEEDLKKKILSSDLEDAAAEKIMDFLSEDISDVMKNLFGSEEKYEELKKGLTDELTEQVLESLQNAGIGEIIANEGQRIIKEKTSGTMLAMFLSDDLLASFIQPMGEEIAKYIAENGKSYIEPEIVSKINSLEKQSMIDFCDKMEITRDDMCQMIASMYHSAVENMVGKMIKQLDISGIVEEKINEMNVDDLEKMVLSVMKKELDTIVNLGALVGGLLGIFNMFF